MSIMKYVKGRYLFIKGARGSGRSQAEARLAVKAALVAQQAKPQAREYIERVELNIRPNVPYVRYKWINTVGNVIGWYSEEELRALRAKYTELAQLPLAPGVADEILRMVAVIDDALGDDNKKGGARA